MTTTERQDGDTAPPSIYDTAVVPQLPSQWDHEDNTYSSKHRNKGCDCSGTYSMIYLLLTFMFLFFVLSLSMIVMGGVHYHDCDAEEEIPALLIVGGCIGCVMGIFFLCCCSGDRQPELKTAVSLFSLYVICVIAGSVYVYKTPFQSTNSTRDDYCDHNLYWYAFWSFTSFYIIVGLVVLMGGLYICCNRR